MSLQSEFAEFLTELWADVEEPTEEKIESLFYAYNLMAEVNGKPPLDFVAEMYDNITGDEVSAVHSHSNDMMWPRIVDSGAWICHNMDGGERVLDLGCGTGHQTLWWATQFPNSEFTGLDISEKSIEVAKRWRNKYQRLLENQEIENVKFLAGNVLDQHEELVGDKFDVITNCYALETIPDLQSQNWKIPEWIIDSLSSDGKIIACLTVPDWQRLATIIFTWREQGFRLNSLNLYPLQNGSSHPYLVMGRQGIDMDLDVIDFMSERASIVHNFAWKIHNPFFDNPMAWGEYDDESLEGIMNHPLRLETWTSEAPEFSALFPSSDTSKPVFEFTHPTWELGGNKITLILDWVQWDVDYPPSPRICFKNIKEMGSDGMEFWRTITEEISDRLPNQNTAPLGYCREYILALNNHFSE